MDYMSCYPHSHLNFILNQLAPLWHIASAQIKLQHTKQIDAIRKSAAFLENVSIERNGPVIVGFAAPRLIPQRPYLCQKLKPNQTEFDVEEDDLQWLVVDNKRKTVPKAGVADLSIHPVKGQTCVYLLGITDPPSLNSCKQKVGDKWYLSAEESQKELEASAEKIEDKLVKAIPCKSWPAGVKKWQTRNRRSGWPKKDTLEKTRQKGIWLIPKRGRKICNKYMNLEWEIVVDTEEFFKAMTDTQKQCFILLKLIRFHSFNFPNILTNEHMLHLLLWVSEIIPVEEWIPENLAENFCFCLDILLDYLAEEDFPHYFLEEANMLNSTHEDHLLDLRKILYVLRHNLVDEIYKFNESYRTNYQPQQYVLRQLFSPLDENAQLDSEDVCRSKQKQCAVKLTDALIEEKSYSAAYVAYSSVRPGSVMSSAVFDASRKLETLANTATDLAQNVQILEFLTDKFPDSSKIWRYRDQLACAYFAQSEASTNPKKKNKLRGKAIRLFQEIQTGNKQDYGYQLNFASMWYKSGEYSKALELTDTILTKEREYFECVHNFDEAHAAIVDENIAKEMKHTPCVTALVSVLAHYIAIMSASKGDKKDDASKLLPRMVKHCDKISSLESTNNSQNLFTQALLGYAAVELNQYERAQTAFRWVSEHAESDGQKALAEENLQNCLIGFSH